MIIVIGLFGIAATFGSLYLLAEYRDWWDDINTEIPYSEYPIRHIISKTLLSLTIILCVIASMGLVLIFALLFGMALPSKD